MKRTILVLIVALWSVPVAQAKPAHKKALSSYFGSFLAKQLNDCRTCHLPDKGDGSEEDKPHNPFGVRLAAVKKELAKSGKKSEIENRLAAIAEEDSDGDGVANVLELVSGHSPGDPADKPGAAELEGARKQLAAFRQSLKTIPWNPMETVQRPDVPTPRTPPWQGGDKGGWVRNPVDSFLAVAHERHGLKPRPEASKHVLLRRLYLDLIGLPPSREELRAFLDDTSPDAYEKVVDRLLANPRHGERWGRHWMDIWRYSDWAGYRTEIRESQPHIWHWRDWIIESLNEDKGYDRMIVEMLAGDEVAPTDPKTLRATGFLVRNWYVFNRNTWMENVVEHTSKSFLGMTMNCARCHDHFFDAITQQEYYQFRAFFEPYHVRTDRIPGEADLAKAGIPRAFDAHLNTPTYLFVRGNEANPDKAKPIPPGVPVLFGGGKLDIQPVTLPVTASCPDKREFVIQETLSASAASVPKARAALQQAQANAVRCLAQVLGHEPLSTAVRWAATHKSLATLEVATLDKELAEVAHQALSAAIRAEQLEDVGKKESPEWQEQATAACTWQRRQAVLEARKQLVVARNALASPAAPAAKKKATPAAPAKTDAIEKALAKAEADLLKPSSTAYTRRTFNYPQAPISYNKTVNTPYPQTSTGRRLGLARWIADRQNPLTARVAINHIWLRHFGKPIVPTVFDFGKNGQPPTHPALLDWLAAEFMEPTAPGTDKKGWSMKKLHRLLVTSSTYRMESTSEPASAVIDPDNRYLWHTNVRRMEAEVIRDSLLHTAGVLDLAMGGPDLDHNLGLTTYRRSLYYQHAPDKQMGFLALFDAANVTECYERSESVVPQQALALANSALAQDQSRQLARRLAKDTGDADAAFVALAFEQVLGRPPSTPEQSECLKFLAEQATLLADKSKLTVFATPSTKRIAPAADPHLRARENLVHVLLNHNDFVTIR